MDSPAAFQSPSSHPSRSRAQTNNLSRPRTTSYAVAVDSRGAIQKRSRQNDHTRSISLSQDRLFRLATEQSNAQFVPPTTSIPDPSLGLQLQWITPQHSPQPQGFSEPVIEAFPQWSVPTPPRSDSGIPNVVDADDSSACIGSSAGFDHFEPATAAEEMRCVTPKRNAVLRRSDDRDSSLGYLLPSQYGASPYESEQNSSKLLVGKHRRRLN
ncbi:uncharacterized protein K489DRAFT_145753 [Dissoconium aciculare CBS 342.82]|uniref:Uncharacterized protein n=1 Tax=Dissoconium aciculare CBS 342.82 TaxID=1314786 RepID=A0A6J3MA97_9PEZI|nr:uncharacterized protein K489DRAFT_145753 [Dissoconium aciculare CBS 342.82]KAF1824951.1 hypothetical protein K489DRAFT_145753 [Dissoconium aciculare CBS 342.82]